MSQVRLPTFETAIGIVAKLIEDSDSSEDIIAFTKVIHSLLAIVEEKEAIKERIIEYDTELQMYYHHYKEYIK